MIQSFEEFLKANKKEWLEDLPEYGINGEYGYSSEGFWVSVEALGEWALEQAVDCIKHKGSLRGYEHGAYEEIAEVCLGKAEVEKRLKKMRK